MSLGRRANVVCRPEEVAGLNVWDNISCQSQIVEDLELQELYWPGGVKSEHAMVHSAPSPSPFPFELKLTLSSFALELKSFGPLFWQNLRGALLIAWSHWWCKKNFIEPGFSKREEISVASLAVCLPVSHVKLWTGHHKGRTGTGLLKRFLEKLKSDAFLTDLEVNCALGVLFVHCTLLCLEVKPLIWPNV